MDGIPPETAPGKHLPAASTRVWGMAGSPRRHGNTEALLDRFLAGAESAGAHAEKTLLARLKIADCVACERCFESGLCSIHDDFDEVYERFLAADVVVLAAPLYFWNLPAQAKALVDRSEGQWARKHVLMAPSPSTPGGHRRRRGVFISTAGQPGADFHGAMQTVGGFFDVWETDLWGKLLYSEVDAKGSIQAHPTALRDAYELGKRAVTEAWSEA